MSGRAMSSSSPSTITPKFQLNISLLLQSVEPSLAAFHAARSRNVANGGETHDILAFSHCARCSVFLLDGTGSVRSVRKPVVSRNKAPGRITKVSVVRWGLRLSCGVCGHASDVLLPVGPSSTFVPPKRPERNVSATRATVFPPTDVAGPDGIQRAPEPPTKDTVRKASSLASPASRVNPRSENKLGLRDLLARSKQRQEKGTDVPLALSTFLQGL